MDTTMDDTLIILNDDKQSLNQPIKILKKSQSHTRIREYFHKTLCSSIIYSPLSPQSMTSTNKNYQKKGEGGKNEMGKISCAVAVINLTKIQFYRYPIL